MDSYIKTPKMGEILLEEFMKPLDLAGFTELERIKLASFMLIYGKHMSHPSEDEAKDLVQQWMIM